MTLKVNDNIEEWFLLRNGALETFKPSRSGVQASGENFDCIVSYILFFCMINDSALLNVLTVSANSGLKLKPEISLVISRPADI